MFNYDYTSELNTDLLFIDADNYEELNKLLEAEFEAEHNDAFKFVFPTDEEIELMCAEA